MTHSTLPHLSPERVSQMAQLATSHAQEARRLPWYQSIPLGSRRLFYGLGASAVTASCIAAFWLLPVAPPQAAMQDISVSEYILQDFLEDIT